MSIYEKLQRARALLCEEKIKKSGKNGHTGFSYYELADFLPSVNKIFAEIGLCSVFNLSKETAVLTIYDIESADNIQFLTPTADVSLKGCTEVQSLGAMHTYLKRYLYLNALEISEADTLDPLVGTDSIIEPNSSSDFDIIAGVDSLNSAKEISSYFNEYNAVVKNKSEFIKAINARRKTIAEIS